MAVNPSATKPINFLDIFHSEYDKQTLIELVNEQIEAYGFQCILYRYKGKQISLGDPLYKDTLTIKDRDLNLYDKIDTWIEIDYNRFNSVLQAYGLAIEAETTLTGNMMLKDKPKEDDLIDIKMPYDQKFYRFKIGSTDVHKDICYNITLDIYNQDNMKNTGDITYAITPDDTNTETITAKTEYVEVPRDKRY
jgi:hypothetical protein